MQQAESLPHVKHYLRHGILADLDELSELAQQQPLRKFERLAVERCLQITVNAAISASVHCCKKAGKSVSGEAYINLLTAHDLLNSQIPHALLKGALGMRNAIVHDYLNLDWTRIEAVLVNKHYHAIGEFIAAGLEYLQE
ncbi:MAG: DUF86 domain-containing protein [Saccharospirillaceae bacterium]|nr:DUF86 domain-containing protein [Saccharospirillaceae bacterium]MCD8530200.1 DUF86 domain-containing protein [Saccharospirillaceae bacterium]